MQAHREVRLRQERAERLRAWVRQQAHVVARIDMADCCELVQPVLLAGLVAVLAARYVGFDLVHRRHLDQRHVDLADRRAVRRRHETVEDAAHLGRAEHHVRRQIIDERAGAHRRSAHDHLAHAQRAERTFVAANERGDLGDDLVLLAVLDLHSLVARAVESDELLRRRRDDLDGGVTCVHQVPRRELEHVRRAADVHRFCEHEAAEVAVGGRLAHDDAGRVRFAGRGAGHEILGGLVAEVRDVESVCLRWRRIEHRAGARHGR